MPQYRSDSADEATTETRTLPAVLRQIDYAVGDAGILSSMVNAPANEPFADDVVDFLDSVSRILLRGRRSGGYADVAAFAFWCRRSSTEHMLETYRTEHGAKNVYRLGRGVVFHIAPSNVAANFAYSMVAGLLAGNANFVRLPSKPFPQVDIICTAINHTLQEYPVLRRYIAQVGMGMTRQSQMPCPRSVT